MKYKQKEKIDEMLNLQIKLNEMANSNWTSESFEWTNAVFVETSEAIDSLKWKWWKTGENDIGNLIVELVDIYHFLMSYMLENISFEDTSNKLLKFANYKSAHTLPLIKTEYDRAAMRDYTIILRDIAINVALYNVDDALIAFFSAWRGVGKTFDDLYIGYIIKNCLNLFRQQNGYKDGTYQKQWAIDLNPSNDVEDNVVAFKLINNIIENVSTDKIMSTLMSELKMSYVVSNNLISDRFRNNISVELLQYTPLDVCATAIRTCWQSFDKSDNGGEVDKELIDRVGNKLKHSSTLEHLIISYKVNNMDDSDIMQLLQNKYVTISKGIVTINVRSIKDIINEFSDTLSTNVLIMGIIDNIPKEYHYLLKDDIELIK